MQLSIKASSEKAEFNALSHTHTPTNTHTHTPERLPPQSLLSTWCVSIFYKGDRWEQKWPALSACPLKELSSHAVPGHSGCGWLLGGEDVASSQVKSNFVPRKLHFHFLLPPSHSAPLKHEDKWIALAWQDIHLQLSCPTWVICDSLLPPSWTTA